jgi:hypothetical protein
MAFTMSFISLLSSRCMSHEFYMAESRPLSNKQNTQIVRHHRLLDDQMHMCSGTANHVAFPVEPHGQVAY